MGTTGTAAARQQPLITNGLGGPSQYTNGDYRQTGDSSPTRPVSQGLISSSISNQSRPNTSGAQSNSTTNTNISNHHHSPSLRPLLGGGQPARPGSTGTDVVPQPAMRHGFAEAYSSEEYLTMLEQVSIPQCRLIMRCSTCTLLMTATKVPRPPPIPSPPSSKTGALAKD